MIFELRNTSGTILIQRNDHMLLLELKLYILSSFFKRIHVQNFAFWFQQHIYLKNTSNLNTVFKDVLQNYFFYSLFNMYLKCVQITNRVRAYYA